MGRRRMIAGIVLATALVFPLSGCAGKVQLSMQKMCASHGGTWSQADETCNMSGAEAKAAKKSARDICQEQGGTYIPGGMCATAGM